MINRRKFIQRTSAFAAAALVLPQNLFSAPANKRVGIQLYTIRDLLKTDFKGTLEKLIAIGYKSIEAAGYANRMFYGMPCGDFKKMITNLGLLPLGSHAHITFENAKQVIDDHLEAGISYLVVPSMPEKNRQSIDGYLRMADEFNRVGELCKKPGLTFGYHNHAFEFNKIDDLIPYEVLLENTDESLLTMEIDTYWMVYGGGEPLDYFRKYPGRFKLWHLKDMDNKDERAFTEIGSGIIDFKGLFEQAELAGMENFFVEQDVFKMDAIQSITRSFNYICSL